MDEVSTAIAAAVEEQSAATAEIARNVNETAQASREVSARINEVSDEASVTGKMAADVGLLSEKVAEAVRDLRTVLIEVVRTSTTDVDRRATKRHVASQSINLRHNGKSGRAKIENISEGGALLVTDMNMVAGGKVELDLLANGTAVRAIIRNVMNDKVSVEFDAMKISEADIRKFSDRPARAA